MLAALPRTRPGRASARRAAAREAGGAPSKDPVTAGKKPARRSTHKVAKPGRATPRPSPKNAAKKRPEPPVPKQGYEPEEEIELGKAVDPPSGGELIESLADIFGELANAGANAGGRLLKDALSIFRRP